MAESGGIGWTVPGYRHVREVGAGASGRVVLAVHEQSGRQVALKYLAPRLLADLRFVERFRAEARLLARLTDPHLVRFYDYVESPYGAAIVMELVPGVSLRTVLDRQRALEPEAALTLLKGSLQGLAAAHAAGIVHRDYKPENVLVPGDGASKLADFGVAVPVGGNAAFAGTPAYMAPEQWASGAVSPATDVYAATVVFFECLAGAKPYQGTTLNEWAHVHRSEPVPVGGVPEPLRVLVAHGMAKNPAERPTTATAFVNELETAARAAYGKDWEVRGRKRLAALAAGLLTLVPSQLADLPPSNVPGQAALPKAGLKGLLSKPALVVPVAGFVTAVVVVTTVLVVRPWDPADTETRSQPTPTPFVTPSKPPPGDDVIVIVRDRVAEKRTANFSYQQLGCCSNQIWASGNLENTSSDASLYLNRVFDGGDAGYVKDREPNYLITDPLAKERIEKTRAYTVGDESYVSYNIGWRSYTRRTAEYKPGEDPETNSSRYKTTARNAFHTRAAVGQQHIEALLSTSGKALPTSKDGTHVYQGTTSTTKVIAKDPDLDAVYGASAYQLQYTLTLGADYLPKTLQVKMLTPGTNVPYWLYEVQYSNWGKGDPIKPPAVEATRTPSGQPKSASPVPSASAATSYGPGS